MLPRLICCSSLSGRAEAKASRPRKLHTACLKIQPARRQGKELVVRKSPRFNLGPHRKL